MSEAALLAPGAALARSLYAQREDRSRGAGDEFALGLAARLRLALQGPVGGELGRLRRRMAEPAAQTLRTLDDAALAQALRERARVAVQGLAESLLHHALLLAAEGARRTLGLQPYPVQVLGAAMLLRGQLAEMATGEGKTLTAGLAATVAAAAGVPTHVATVNDYLAERDARTLQPLYTLFGLGVGCVVHGLTPAQRRAAYACSVTYCTGKELVFDYLRDRVAHGSGATAAQVQARALFGRAQGEPPLLRGLHFAIVDEADSILIDEARTPLILAEEAGEYEHAAAVPTALALARELQEGVHYTVLPATRALQLTLAGQQALQQACSGRGTPWGARVHREHLVSQALRALHLYRRDQHYLVDDEGKVQIIDEYTGRVLQGRTWEQGLHQLIECKEGVALSPRTRTLSRITYQRFFVRYLRLGGMSGTVREVASELAVVYGLMSRRIPTHRPSARRSAGVQLCSDEAQKWQSVLQAVRAAHARGQPVLVGTRSLQASERLSALLHAAGLAHAVLNARQDAEEAAVVAEAGQPGRITVATNMAGRGTDIHLGEDVAAAGGLMVVLTEYHESQRIDRQLVGRCARQGEPGLALAVVAADDELFLRHGGLLRHLLVHPWALPLLRTLAQQRAEALHRRQRHETLRQDRRYDQLLAYAGHAP